MPVSSSVLPLAHLQSDLGNDCGNPANNAGTHCSARRAACYSSTAEIMRHIKETAW
jgi:hypothetical protein